MKATEYEKIFNETLNENLSQTAIKIKLQPIFIRCKHRIAVCYGNENYTFSFNTKAETFKNTVISILNNHNLTIDKENILK